MTTYTLVLQVGDDPDTTEVKFEAESFADAKAKGDALFERSGATKGYLAIGRGEGDEVEWIGAFDFAPGRAPRWEAAD